MVRNQEVLINLEYLWDTCSFQKSFTNSCYFDMIKIHLEHDNYNSICDVTKNELEKNLHLKINEIIEKFQHISKKEIYLEQISSEEITLSIKLLKKYYKNGLHYPDNKILAHAINSNKILITCDKSLYHVAKLINHPVIFSNLTDGIIDILNSNTNKIIKTNVLPSMKKEISKKIVKKVTKISWSAFVQ